MKTITREYQVYTYDELSDDAKEVVKRWYLEGQPSYMFTEECMYDLEQLFPNSDLKVEYSLNYCQGDGFNIYGNISLLDLLENLKEYFTAKEFKFLTWTFNEFNASFDMSHNNSYHYCICDKHDFVDEIIDEMEWQNMRNIRYKTLEWFNEKAREFLSELCSKYEGWGYDYFYEISDEDLSETCNANDYVFIEDGKIFY